jgi:hypothetical protein
VATQQTRSKDEVVPQRPEDVRVMLTVPHSATASVGAATAFVLRRVAYRAGAYAPGIQEHLFHELTTPRAGVSIEAVFSWFQARSPDLNEIGYRIQARRVAERTEGIATWVREGGGFRGAVLPTAYTKLHPNADGDDLISYGVGLVIDRLEPSAAEDLLMIDPWPGANGARDRGALPATLGAAHRDRRYHALIFYWNGWA